MSEKLYDVRVDGATTFSTDSESDALMKMEDLLEEGIKAYTISLYREDKELDWNWWAKVSVNN